MDKDKSIKLSCDPGTSKGHSFHKTCVLELKEKGHRKCPQCRADVPELQVLRISIPNIAREKLEGIWYSGRMVGLMGELLEINNIEEVIPKLITIFTPFHDTDDPGYVRLEINIQTDIFSDVIASYWREIHNKIRLLNSTIHTQKGEIRKKIGVSTKKEIEKLFLYIFSHLNIIQSFFQNIPQSLLDRIENLKIIPILIPIIPTLEEIKTQEEQDIIRMIDYIRRFAE